MSAPKITTLANFTVPEAYKEACAYLASLTWLPEYRYELARSLGFNDGGDEPKGAVFKFWLDRLETGHKKADMALIAKGVALFEGPKFEAVKHLWNLAIRDANHISELLSLDNRPATPEEGAVLMILDGIQLMNRGEGWHKADGMTQELTKRIKDAAALLLRYLLPMQLVFELDDACRVFLQGADHSKDWVAAVEELYRREHPVTPQGFLTDHIVDHLPHYGRNVAWLPDLIDRLDAATKLVVLMAQTMEAQDKQRAESATAAQQEEVNDLKRTNDALQERTQCHICWQGFFDTTITPCGHVMCGYCLQRHRNRQAEQVDMFNQPRFPVHTCPDCRGPIRGAQRLHII